VGRAIADTAAAAQAHDAEVRRSALRGNPSAGWRLVRVSVDPIEQWAPRDSRGWALSYKLQENPDGTCELFTTRTDDGWLSRRDAEIERAALEKAARLAEAECERDDEYAAYQELDPLSHPPCCHAGRIAARLRALAGERTGEP